MHGQVKQLTRLHGIHICEQPFLLLLLLFSMVLLLLNGLGDGLDEPPVQDGGLLHRDLLGRRKELTREVHIQLADGCCALCHWDLALCHKALQPNAARADAKLCAASRR